MFKYRVRETQVDRELINKHKPYKHVEFPTSTEESRKHSTTPNPNTYACIWVVHFSGVNFIYDSRRDVIVEKNRGIKTITKLLKMMGGSGSVSDHKLLSGA